MLAFVVWIAFIRDGDSGNGGPNSKGATVAQLRDLQAEVGHPVYWAGRQSGSTLELTRTGRGDIYVRYLPPGVPVGDERPNYLTVGTYRFKNAYATGIYVVNSDRPPAKPGPWPGFATSWALIAGRDSSRVGGGGVAAARAPRIVPGDDSQIVPEEEAGGGEATYLRNARRIPPAEHDQGGL